MILKFPIFNDTYLFLKVLNVWNIWRFLKKCPPCFRVSNTLSTGDSVTLGKKFNLFSRIFFCLNSLIIFLEVRWILLSVLRNSVYFYPLQFRMLYTSFTLRFNNYILMSLLNLKVKDAYNILLCMILNCVEIL